MPSDFSCHAFEPHLSNMSATNGVPPPSPPPSAPDDAAVNFKAPPPRPPPGPPPGMSTTEFKQVQIRRKSLTPDKVPDDYNPDEHEDESPAAASPPPPTPPSSNGEPAKRDGELASRKKRAKAD